MRSSLIAFLFVSPLLFAQAEDQFRPEIMQIIEDFRISIIEKDEERFLDLFYNGPVPWLGVWSDSSLDDWPDPNDVPPKVFSDTHEHFIEGIANSTRDMEETFSDIEIKSDGDIASVYFKYSFLNNGYKTNWGDEEWQLVRTSSGWKINSVIYSVILNTEPRDGGN